MKLLVNQITETPQTLRFAESVDELNQLFRARECHEFRFPRAADVSLVFYRSGREIFLQGSFHVVLEGECSRCLEAYAFPIDNKFHLVLVPGPPEKDRKKELNPEEMGVSFYQGGEINLVPLIQEQVLLALPMRALCDEQCRGLCVGCGVNLNAASCLCKPVAADEGMARRSLRVGR